MNLRSAGEWRAARGGQSLSRAAAGVLLFACGLPADAAQVKGLRAWAAPEHTRVVLDLSQPVRYKVFSLQDPHRVVLDLQQARWHGRFPRIARADHYLRGLRSAPRGNGDWRLVLDLKRPAKAKDFLLLPNGRHGHRLVLDLLSPQRRTPAKRMPGKGGAARKGGGYKIESRSRPRSAPRGAPRGAPRSEPGSESRSAKLSPPLRRGQPLPEAQPLRDVIVAIDAGHGGADPGATGPHGSREKVIALQIARQLEKRLARMPGIRPVMVRKGDYYMKLGARVRKARERKADLFVSIHADSFRDPRVRGSSVYVLSRKRSSSEHGRLLAQRENAADLIGGVSISDKDDLLASVLLDLSQTAALESSIEAAQLVLAQLRKAAPAGRVHKRHVESAGFMVLRAPDIPSILVEAGFISNPQEEKRLLDPAYQNRIAHAISRGVLDFFSRRAPEGTLLASRRQALSQN